MAYQLSCASCSNRCHPQIARVSSFTRATLPNFRMA